MATQSPKTGLPKFLAGAMTPEKLREQFIDSPMAAAGQPALASLGELSALLGILPEAFVASQRRELERVKRSAIENDPRIAVLETSIAQTEGLQTMVRQGQTRVQKTVLALAGKDNVFHGFVSDADFAPMKGLTVRLIGSESTRSRGLSAVTDDNGYFSIVLGAKTGAKRDSGAKAGPVNVSQRLDDLGARLSKEPNSLTAATPEAETSRVEILLKGKLLHSDTVPVAHDEGSIYREYVIADTESPAARTRKFSRGQESVRRTTTQKAKAEAREASKEDDTRAGAAEPESSFEESVKKRSRRATKSTKPKSKK